MRSSTSSWLERAAPMLVVALTVRLGVAFLLPPPDDFMFLTETGQTAANLVSGQGYTFDFYGTRPERPLVAFAPPLHTWLVALALQFRDAAQAYGVLQAFLGTLNVWLVRKLATGLASGGTGALVGWGAALYPAHVLLVGQPLSTVLHASCLSAVLLASWQTSQRPTVERAVLAGGLVGLFALGRPQILAFVPFIIAWLWLNQVRGRKLWRLAVALVLAAAIVVLPWCIRNTVVLGQPAFLATYGGVTFWNGNNPFTTCCGHDVDADKLAAYLGIERDPDLPDVYQPPGVYPYPPEIESRLQTLSEVELDRAFYRAGLGFVSQYPADWLSLEGRKLLSFWLYRPNLGANPLYRGLWTILYRIQYAVLLVPTLIGVAVSQRQWRRYALLYSILAYYTLVQLAFNVLTRYRWEIELLMLIFAGLAWETVRAKLNKGS